MGDLMLRVSLLVQRGYACETCGREIDGQMTGAPRSCLICAVGDDGVAATQARDKLGGSEFRASSAGPGDSERGDNDD
ncbi:MAG: hypothetical protein ACKV0T_21610 [Planctomycetales bacterium]